MEKEDKELRFHIIITDNETGETLLDKDADAIVGGVDAGDMSHLITYTKCGPMDLATAIIRAEDAVRAQYENHPEMESLVKFLRTVGEGPKKTAN